MKRKRQPIEKISQYEVVYSGFSNEEFSELTEVLKGMLEESSNVSESLGLKAFPVYLIIDEDYEYINPLKNILEKKFNSNININLHLVQADRCAARSE